jgi:tRNA-dihydrouridine synthase B
MVGRVVRACAPTPVTAKIRLGQTRDAITAVEVARAVEEAGGAALTVHGRTAQDMYRGRADWEAIAAVKPHLRTIPLIGNGDLRSAEEAAAAFARYGVDGVMIGRAALHRPWIFRQVRAALRGEPIPPDPSPGEQRDLLLRHYQLVVERFGPQRGTLLMRRYACCYAMGQPGARKFRARMSTVATVDEFNRTVREHFPAEDRPGFPDDPGMPQETPLE